MTTGENKVREIALNVTRTRVTVLAFNLTIVSFMLSIKVTVGEFSDAKDLSHLPSTVALFAGFCVTILGLWWLLVSQNQDAEGLSRPWPFTFGAITTYLALSQTTNAFLHEYLVALTARVMGAEKTISGGIQSLLGNESLGYTASLVLLSMGAAIWFLVTYIAPLLTVLRAPLAGRHAWVFAMYYLAIQLPIFWVYAVAWQLVATAAHTETSILTLFGFQFFPPLLWSR
jgi:hypothetical protein